MDTRTKLTDAIEHKIIAWIHSGAFAHVAAEAAGVRPEVFEQWLAWGTRTRPRPIPRYRRFAHHVRQAVAVGRLLAEARVYDKDPKTWLLSGPGKEQADCPGWSATVKAVPRRSRSEVNLLADPRLADLVQNILKALEGFPDARQAVAAALESEGERRGVSPPVD
jgi:hypothetical protein